MDETYRLEIPTPFDVGLVNCYVFPGNGLALLDPGPATEAAYEELSTGLNAHGHSIADVTQVLITHSHMDHFGLADRIVDESGARTGAHRNAVEALADPADLLARERTFFEPFLRTMGVPEQAVTSAIILPEAYTEYREPLTIDRATNRTLRAAGDSSASSLRIRATTVSEAPTYRYDLALDETQGGCELRELFPFEFGLAAFDSGGEPFGVIVGLGQSLALSGLVG